VAKRSGEGRGDALAADEPEAVTRCGNKKLTAEL
jgi:hypothetical protein